MAEPAPFRCDTTLRGRAPAPRSDHTRTNPARGRLDARASEDHPQKALGRPMDDEPLIPSPLFGLRTWRVEAGEEGERLAAAQKTTSWPGGGRWLEASCDADPAHEAPAAGCLCGIHAWHPSTASARRVLAGRATVAGIVEAAGRIELHEDGFRAQRARPYALVAGPHDNAHRVQRLARLYGVPVVPVGSAAELVAWCRERGLGLAPEQVAALMGPEVLAHARHDRARRRRRARLRVLAYTLLVGVLTAVSVAFFTGPPSPKGVYGRMGWVVRPQTVPPTRVVSGSAPRGNPAANARETTRARRSRCLHGGPEHRARNGRRGSARTRVAGRRCRAR